MTARMVNERKADEHREHQRHRNQKRKRMRMHDDAKRERDWASLLLTPMHRASGAVIARRTLCLARRVGDGPRQAWLNHATPAGVGIRLSPRRGQDHLRPDAGALSSHQNYELCARHPTHGEPIFASPTPSIAKTVRLGRTTRGGGRRAATPARNN